MSISYRVQSVLIEVGKLIPSRANCTQWVNAYDVISRLLTQSTARTCTCYISYTNHDSKQHRMSVSPKSYLNLVSTNDKCVNAASVIPNRLLNNSAFLTIPGVNQHTTLSTSRTMSAPMATSTPLPSLRCPGHLLLSSTTKNIQ